MAKHSDELQQAWDKILALDQQLTVANGRLASALQELNLIKSQVKQHCTDLLKTLGRP